MTQAPNYCVRKLDVTRSSKGGLGGQDSGRVIVHLQLTDWPDRYSIAHTDCTHVAHTIHM